MKCSSRNDSVINAADTQPLSLSHKTEGRLLRLRAPQTCTGLTKSVSGPWHSHHWDLHGLQGLVTGFALDMK